MSVNEKMTAIANAIREKTGKSELITLDAMPGEIRGIETGGGGAGFPEEVFNITGNCQYRFAYGGWDWFIRDYGNRITTSNISNLREMFNNSNIENIPFDLNVKKSQYMDFASLFSDCHKLKSIPKINSIPTIREAGRMFFYCYQLRYLPEDIADWFDWSYMDAQTTMYSCDRSSTFSHCHSLRSIPMSFLSHANPKSSYSYTYFSYGFQHCYVLDELVDLPIPYTATYTSNLFNATFDYNSRLKNMTFALQENGLPIEVNWKNQVINLVRAGYVEISTGKPMSEWNAEYLESEKQRLVNIIGYNSGITLDKAIYNDETYALLKDDPDSFCIANSFNAGNKDYRCYDYSRYNHDSAVATINSLPDTSAYLATAGGTNTIKFRGAVGAKTDGGAINTLTQEEIAVATAKGWTVSLT